MITHLDRPAPAATAGSPPVGGPDRAGTFGLPTATALVIGSVIGTGVFCLLLGVPIYIWLKVGRREYGETPGGHASVAAAPDVPTVDEVTSATPEAITQLVWR